ncbi:MAG TPA: hypothetical protein VM866_00270, partial [Pyrinomonadaceae bacterium]|nr:hypothetical protein [Pyrinomonadaceae bacterium]
MKKRFSTTLVTLLAIALLVPSFAFAQRNDRLERRPPNVDNSGGRTTRRERPRAEGAEGLEQDFAEALTVIQENYVDGNKLDYNNAFKSSI